MKFQSWRKKRAKLKNDERLEKSDFYVKSVLFGSNHISCLCSFSFCSLIIEIFMTPKIKKRLLQIEMACSEFSLNILWESSCNYDNWMSQLCLSTENNVSTYFKFSAFVLASCSTSCNISMEKKSPSSWNLNKFSIYLWQISFSFCKIETHWPKK